MIARLTKNPHLARYLQGLGDQPSPKKLECIYLDTASMLGTQAVPSKWIYQAEAVDGLLELIGLYPQDTQFYINAWTWGYEDIFLMIKAHFNNKIHVDRYKYSVLCSLDNYVPSPSITSEPRSSFKDILTCDASTTRFHACERFNQCGAVRVEVPQPIKRKTHRASIIRDEPTKRVVYINPSAMAEDAWKTYVAEVAGRLRGGQFVDALRVPLSRHSTLVGRLGARTTFSKRSHSSQVELQSFVALFRPRNIFPNTLVPYLDGLDWACLPGIFAHCLSLGGYETLRKSTLDGLRERFPGIDLSQKGMELRAKQALRKIGRPDSDHDNAVGSASGEWNEEQTRRLRRTQEHIEMYLPWLFGRQDTPLSETDRVITPKVNVGQALTLTAGPEELCATCAHCPTYGPKRQPDSLRPISADQITVSTTVSPKRSANMISLSGTGANTAIFRQRTGQTNPPLLESIFPYTRHADKSPNYALNNVAERPSKKPRMEFSRVAPRSPSSRATASPASSPTTLQTPGSATHQRENESNRSVSLPRQRHGSCSHELPDHNPDHGQFDSSGTTPDRNCAPPQTDATTLQQLVVQPDAVASTSEMHNDLNDNHVQRLKTVGPALYARSEPSSSSSSATRQSTSLHDSDWHEQRRLSKLKERQIRNQLARLPPEFSQSLAATKSIARTRPATPNPDAEPTRNALVQRMQSGDLGPLDLDLGCVRSQSQGEGAS
ncbi:hypothetical protein FRC10_007091 [Ceratobasidium sp. 414]|nr:hypothetical protein FRC10_007091 [Ceratobasidium sp. 414]